ncbi:MAG: DNA internalization-related competence protein ComEC/Rec2 [Limosilactobacillus sp.]|uniref:DNA internalization-related competence protein ComEC/Rec2 n=1 Tax=Limosilactobacillus sp. TaxID=2773925 RepID=UPI0026F63A1B|nr:DNA internalization-related competence protein ComEC/Rec2 [Limosilactobacillus sp.]
MATGRLEDSHQLVTISFSARSQGELNRYKFLSGPSVWQVRGSMQPLYPATNDQQFDSRFYNQQRRIYNEVRAKQVAVVQRGSVHGIDQLCHQMRYQLERYFKRMPQPLAGYCQQLIIGDSSGSNSELDAAVRRLGIIHLFCISGMHIILITNLVQVVGAYLGIEKELLDRMLIVFLPMYLIIGGGSTSLVRAVIMAEVALCQKILKMDGLDGWAISLIVGLLWNPYLLFNLGGQLSYLLSLSLPLLEKGISPLKQCWWLSLLSLPAILYHVFEFHLLSLVASYVMIPLFGTLIFPLVVISAVSFLLTPVIANIGNSLLLVFQRLLTFFSDLPGEIHYGKPSLWWAVILFIVTLCLIENSSKRWYVILGSLYFACFMLIHFPLHGEVTFVDIGQGDNIIVETPFKRRVYMIDTGGKVTFQQPKWAKMYTKNDVSHRVTVNYLKSQGISKVDTIYLSHHDADHIGYLPTVIKEMDVKQVAVPAGMESQSALINKLRESDFDGQLIPVTDKSKQINPELKAVHPFAPGKAENGDSMALYGRFGGHNFMFTGDLDRKGELEVLQHYPGIKADVLKLGHHGSRTASDPQFLKGLGVRIGIISAGRFNRYKHPNDEVVAELKQDHILPLSTQQYGMIKYQYYGDHGRWITKLKGDELRWTLPNSLNN